jgi:hypothetical protein
MGYRKPAFVGKYPWYVAKIRWISSGSEVLAKATMSRISALLPCCPPATIAGKSYVGGQYQNLWPGPDALLGLRKACKKRRDRIVVILDSL